MREDSSETTVEMPISNRVQERINKLIGVGFSDEGFLSLRTNKDLYDEFETFVNFCLVHCVTSMDWRYNACNNVISDIFSVTDEAFCILLLENNLVDYQKAAGEKRKIQEKNRNLDTHRVVFQCQLSKDGIGRESGVLIS